MGLPAQPALLTAETRLSLQPGDPSLEPEVRHASLPGFAFPTTSSILVLTKLSVESTQYFLKRSSCSPGILHSSFFSKLFFFREPLPATHTSADIKLQAWPAAPGSKPLAGGEPAGSPLSKGMV